ncbi:hypothetical protein HanRHA438_Chr17g0824471 [Helianthus annuus]|uniref:Uncharacterized protein n=1 Tax=Helianthus annuus TaxID=4232 RepID=A0A251RSP5_HELAN|nr:uncharacterized protein LOC110922830 [Helianthus annuus]KAF5756422.1 hypothetical protein HanXRQr2_Chr17g0814431 [Helianthus annuus]KAJ0448371.1 hypothetical protein HanHA89_Chr17g0716031 [Helianthus annuus]KAJ0814145.1 hypothetical protein HanPSC8_Chr17g0782041 [Helianthus annuus]KAJ0827334.1 hypothetical protein HanRHA438_Chr17g0824471 [Helianthus annuus]
MAENHQPPLLTVVLTGTLSDPHENSNTNLPPQTAQSPLEQPPHSETLDFSTTPQSPLDHHGVQIPQKSHKQEHTLTLPDAFTQQSHQKHGQNSGITLSNDTETLISPSNRNRRRNFWKKSGKRKSYGNRWLLVKIRNLTEVFSPIPFVPKALNLSKHEDVLKRLRLYDFSKVELDSSIRKDLLVQLIVSYDRKKRCGYVNGKRINVNRADLARALELPVIKQDKGGSKADVDSEVFSVEEIGFIEDFVFNWVLLHEESWIMPVELVNWTRCIRDGHPEKLDSASLIWYKVEKELTQGEKLGDCYYASHLQRLIRSQHGEVFMVDGGGGDEGEENVKVDEEHEKKDDCEEKDEHEEKEEQEEKVFVVQEEDVELTLGLDVEKIVNQDVREHDQTMVDADECKEGVEVEMEKMDGQVNLKNNLGQQTLQRCQSSDMNDYEETKVEKVVDEQIQQVDEMEEQVNWKNDLGERILQPCQSRDLNSYEEVRVEEAVDEQVEQLEDEDDEEEEEEEEGGGDDGEGFVEGFNLEANDDSVDRDGLTDHIPYSSHGISAINLFGSRDDSFMSHGGPSFFDNRGKRVMEPEENMHHLDGNSKRLKADEMWDDQEQTDFDSCMVQAQQWMEKAMMIINSSEEFYANSKYQQDLAMNELRDRHQAMEMTIKSKDEELVKVNYEVFRLERELYLMGDLVTGYRKALNDTRIKFSEYRKRVALQEEPLFKDAGPGGVVLSTRELEKQRLKQKETQKPRGELELSTGPEKNQKSLDKQESSQKPVENQKSHDEVPDNDASMEEKEAAKNIDGFVRPRSLLCMEDV